MAIDASSTVEVELRIRDTASATLKKFGFNAAEGLGRFDQSVRRVSAGFSRFGFNAAEGFRTVDRAVQRVSGGLTTFAGRFGTFFRGIGSGFQGLIGKLANFRTLFLGIVVGGVTRGIDALLTRAGDLKRVADGFTALTGGAEGFGRELLGRTREATRGLIDDMTIMRQANQAIQLGIPATAESFSELANVAVRLGRAVGRSAAASIEDLTIGIGRQSRLILDNLGLIVDTSKAYEDYAKSIGVATDQLTVQEQKLAFYNATLDAAKRKAETLGEIQLDAADQFTRVKNTITNYVSAVLIGISESGVLAEVIGTLNTALQHYTGIQDEAAAATRDTSDAIEGSETVARTTALAVNNLVISSLGFVELVGKAGIGLATTFGFVKGIVLSVASPIANIIGVTIKGITNLVTTALLQMVEFTAKLSRIPFIPGAVRQSLRGFAAQTSDVAGAILGMGTSAQQAGLDIKKAIADEATDGFETLLQNNRRMNAFGAEMDALRLRAEALRSEIIRTGSDAGRTGDEVDEAAGQVNAAADILGKYQKSIEDARSFVAGFERAILDTNTSIDDQVRLVSALESELPGLAKVLPREEFLGFLDTINRVTGAYRDLRIEFETGSIESPKLGPVQEPDFPVPDGVEGQVPIALLGEPDQITADMVSVTDLIIERFDLVREHGGNMIAALKAGFADLVVSGIDRLAFAVGDIFTGVQKTGEALKQVFRTVVADGITMLVRLGLQKLILGKLNVATTRAEGQAELGKGIALSGVNTFAWWSSIFPPIAPAMAALAVTAATAVGATGIAAGTGLSAGLGAGFAAAEGGVAFGPTRGVFGEAGTELFLPLSSARSRRAIEQAGLGGGQSDLPPVQVSVTVDARGALSLDQDIRDPRLLRMLARAAEKGVERGLARSARFRRG